MTKESFNFKKSGASFLASLSVALATLASTLLISGCSSPDIPRTGSMEDPFQAPAFLTGPASSLFTNVDGFSARVSLTASGKSKPVTGLLLGRGTRLLFAPDPKNGVFAKKRPTDGTSFVWDAADSTGYVVSETMQGYAAISSPIKPRNISSQPAGTGSTSVNGYECRAAKATASLSDGTMMEVNFWKASELRDFPVRLKSAEGQFTIELSKIRLETPSSETFLPPEGFTRFPNAESMLSILLERHAALKKKSMDDGPDLESGPPQAPHQNIHGGY